MSKCERCKIEIVDDSMVCPLCHGVIAVNRKGAVLAEGVSTEENVEYDPEESERSADAEMYYSHSAMYPDVSPAMRRIKFVIKLVVFLSVLVESALILINYLTYNGVKWSLITGVVLAYLCFTVIYSFQRYSGYRRKIMWQTVGIMILAILIDIILGFRGWSVEFAIPSAVLAIDLTIFILMLVNAKDFQEYLMMQIFNFVLSILFLVVVLVVHLVDFSLLIIIAAGVTGLMLLATLVFGDKAVLGELTRRFRM